MSTSATALLPPAARRDGWVAEWAAVLLPIALLAALAVPRLPPGICFGDSGDLQVASATLGMAHPPGYAGFASLGHLLTLIPGLQPTYAVTLGCMGSALLALALIVRLQIRLGANVWLAAATTLGLAASARIWEALIIPEVYAPNLALHAAATWFFVSYVQTGRLRRLALAGLLLGFAVANRPSALLSVPGFALALVLWVWQHQQERQRWVKVVSVSLFTLLIPCVYTLAYYCVRDVPEGPLNIIENYRIFNGGLPAATAGAAAKLERAFWLASAREYHWLLGGSWAQMCGRGRWLTERLGLSNDICMIATTCATVLGGALVWRRCRSAAIALVGMALGAAAFFCAYQAYDTAADVLPVLFTIAIFFGVCASALLPSRPTFAKPMLGVLAFVAAAVWVAFNANQPLQEAEGLDATHLAAAADLSGLPQNAAVLSDWMRLPPLRYAQYRLNRFDLEIMLPKTDRQRETAARLAGGEAGRPLFSTTRFSPPPGYEAVRRDTLWQVRPLSAAAKGDDGVLAPKRDDGVDEGAQEQQ